MNLAPYIDHTILSPNCTEEQIVQLAKEAKQYGFASICIPPNFVFLAALEVQDSEVKVCTVIGFPLGYSTTATKVFEAQNAIDNGADEIDMVIAINQAKSGQWDVVAEDIQSVHEICLQEEKKLKVIVETALLTVAEKQKVYDICSRFNVDFVKTSTGFSTAGATVEDVELMRASLPPQIEIKASGGIRDGEFARALIKAGASRLGCSSSINVINS